MSLAGDLMEIPEGDVVAHYPAATAMLTALEHAPRIAAPREAPAPERSPGVAGPRRFRSTTPGLATRSTARPGTVRLIERIEGADPLVSPTRASVLHALRRAVAVALAVSGAYAEATGLAEMRRANLARALPAPRQAEFAERLAAEAVIALHVLADALSVLLAPLAPEVTAEAEAEEVLTDTAQIALHGALWEIDGIAAEAEDDARLVAALLAWAEGAMEAAARRAAHMPRLEPFTAAAYRVEADDLTIRGFAPSRRGRGGAPAMTFKAPSEVVGNHIAKHQAMRLARMLVAYDFERRLNPFAEMGGFVFTFMGDGAPGTGKTTLIQMMAGLIHGYCETAGYPFRYRNLSTDSIDSYQGKSAQNARAFVDEVLDPAVIGFGTIDDIDQLAGRRGDRQSSAGQLEITAVLMDAFAGARTVVRGNCTFGMFSNFPEQVDDALRQRAGARFLVDGPQSREDYVDILALLLGRHHDIPLGQHDLYAAQEIRRAVERSYAGHDEPAEAGLRAVWDDVTARLGALETIEELGAYLHAIHEMEPRFTGRAIKNVTDAVKLRAMDFDLPDEWMEEPDLFLRKPYEEKRAMIEALRRPVTADIVVQEINRYADSEFRYSDRSDEAAVEAMVRDMERTAEARRRYAEGAG